MVPDVVNIYIWLNEHDKFKGKPKFKRYVIFVLTLTLLLQYFCAIYILYLVDFLEGVWGVFMGITTDKDKSEAMICKEMQVTSPHSHSPWLPCDVYGGVNKMFGIELLSQKMCYFCR